LADQTPAPAENGDVLDSHKAGGIAIRGGALRTAAYGAAMLMSLISVPFMTRHLGVSDFGRFVTVSSIVFIIGGITEAGLTNLGIREYAVRDGQDRQAFLRHLAGLRFLLTGIGILVAGFLAWVTGSETVIVEGTLIAGLGLMLALTQQTYAIPLTAQLRFGWVTALELLRQATLTISILVLIVLGASLLPFFATTIVSGLAVLVATLLVVHKEIPLRPSVDRVAWREILRDVLPYAVATAVGLIYFRLAVILMSYVSTDYDTGIYSAAFRIVEVIGVIPWILVSSGFPILARAARDDESRLTYALQRLFEVSAIFGAWIALVVAIAASFAVDVIAGLPEFEDSVPVLRVLGLAVVTSFLVATWSFALLSIRAHRELLICNAIAAVVATVGVLVLAPAMGAMGAAIATLGAEASLALAYIVALRRGRSALTPQFGVVAKVLVAAAIAGCAVFVPIHVVAQAIVASIVFWAVLLVLRAVPVELYNAALRRDPEAP
jgi:O-antigen/teichoic acid export membrane protein